MPFSKFVLTVTTDNTQNLNGTLTVHQNGAATFTDGESHNDKVKVTFGVDSSGPFIQFDHTRHNRAHYRMAHWDAARGGFRGAVDDTGYAGRHKNNSDNWTASPMSGPLGKSK